MSFPIRQEASKQGTGAGAPGRAGAGRRLGSGGARTPAHPGAGGQRVMPCVCPPHHPTTYTCAAPGPCWGRRGAGLGGSGSAAGTPAWSGCPGRPRRRPACCQKKGGGNQRRAPATSTLCPCPPPVPTSHKHFPCPLPAPLGKVCAQQRLGAPAPTAGAHAAQGPLLFWR